MAALNQGVQRILNECLADFAQAIVLFPAITPRKKVRRCALSAGENDVNFAIFQPGVITDAQSITHASGIPAVKHFFVYPDFFRRFSNSVV
ncbi:hypothetical protein [Pseudomonas sp.]|uniref:hypothetical protein n=1 Tax=Pseudomonas sp. TaxID=306 RepID=UPI003D6F21DA